MYSPDPGSEKLNISAIAQLEDGRVRARTAPSVRLLMTSQALGDAAFEIYWLPPGVGEFVEQLLKLYLGDAGARRSVGGSPARHCWPTSGRATTSA